MRTIYTYYLTTFIVSSLQLTMLGSQQVYWIQEEGRTEREKISIDYEFFENSRAYCQVNGSKGFAFPIDKKRQLSVPDKNKFETITADWKDMVQRELAAHELCRKNGLFTLEPKQVDVYAEEDSKDKLCTTLVYPSFDVLADKEHYVMIHTKTRSIHRAMRWARRTSMLPLGAFKYEKKIGFLSLSLIWMI